MPNQTVIPPDLDDVLAELKNSIFANINCIQIGKIEKVNENQTVEIMLQFKRRVKNSETIDYPMLVDCPYFVLQGGGAYLDMPIKPGDYCIVLFNDRNIDTWWDTANVKEPLTRRKHSLSDGIALVGINPKTSVLDLSGDRVVLNATGFPLEIKTDKTIDITATEANTINGSTVELNGNTKPFVTHAELDTALQSYKTQIDGYLTALYVLLGTPYPGSILDISLSATTTVKTGG